MWKEYKYRLENRIKELLGQQVVDENRMMMEIAILLTGTILMKSLLRLKSHICQFRDTLEMDVPIGRKLDFSSGDEQGGKYNWLKGK